MSFVSSATEKESKFLFFFASYFLVDYESIDSILKILFGDVLERERSYDFTMHVVYVCALMFLF